MSKKFSRIAIPLLMDWASSRILRAETTMEMTRNWKWTLVVGSTTWHQLSMQIKINYWFKKAGVTLWQMFQFELRLRRNIVKVLKYVVEWIFSPIIFKKCLKKQIFFTFGMTLIRYYFTSKQNSMSLLNFML